MTRLPIISPPIPPESITSGADRFRCAKMSAVITAADCAKRHAAAHADNGGRSTAKKFHQRVAANSAFHCHGCQIGPGVIHPRLNTAS